MIALAFTFVNLTCNLQIVIHLDPDEEVSPDSEDPEAGEEKKDKDKVHHFLSVSTAKFL